MRHGSLELHAARNSSNCVDAVTRQRTADGVRLALDELQVDQFAGDLHVGALDVACMIRPAPWTPGWRADDLPDEAVSAK